MNHIVCPYFGHCGGCLYQDIPLDSYLEKKKNFILSAFRHVNIDPPLLPIQVIPFGSRRRATFAFQKGIIGFNEHKSHKIIALDHCPALTPALSNMLPTLKKLIRELSSSGDISVLETTFGIDMHIKTGKNLPTLRQRELLANFAHQNNIVRLLFNKEPILQKVQLPFPPDTFLQPSQEGEDMLIDIVTKNIENEKHILDLFCGTGTFTKPLLKKGLNVTGYDVEEQSVACLGKNGVQRDLFRNPLLPTELRTADAVIIDPPRAGAKAQTEQLAQSTVSKIIMISCNPITAARDIKEFVLNGWHLESIYPVDQFIYSNHIEIVCILNKKPLKVYHTM